MVSKVAASAADAVAGITDGSTILVGGKPEQLPRGSQAIEPSVNADGSIIAYAVTIPDLQREVDEAARNQLDELILGSDGSGPAERSVIVMSSTPALAIVEYAKDHAIDLIVMGTHGRGPLAHLMMGSVAERVVRLAPCPVLTVRHPEHEFVHPDALPVAARSRA